MPIAIDNISTGTGGNGQPTWTWSHACSGQNRILFVAYRMGAGQGNQVSGITYNGVAMTFVNFTGGGGEGAGLYYLVAPYSGTANIVATMTSSSYFAQFCSASYTGARQTGGLDNSTTNTGSSTASFTTSLTTVASNCWTVLSSKASTADISAGTGSYIRTGSDGSHKLADSNGAIAPARNYSMQLTTASSVNWAGVMASFAPVPEGGAFLYNML